jgi:hypothetical protein
MKNFFLPGNTPGVDAPVVPVEYPPTAPVSVVVKKQPFNFDLTPDALPSRAEEAQEMDASKFPKLRGFA